MKNFTISYFSFSKCGILLILGIYHKHNKIDEFTKIFQKSVMFHKPVCSNNAY